MKTVNKFLFCFIICFANVEAQTNNNPMCEIGGNILYSYSHTVLSYTNVSGVYRIEQTQLEPEFGFYLDPNIELIFDLSYGLNYYSSNAPISNIDLTVLDKLQIHRLGAFLGAAYNYKINKSIILVLGTKAGLSITRWIESDDWPDGFSTYYDSGWRRIELSFPAFWSGVKINVNPKWDILFKVQYIKTKHYQGFDNQDNDLIAFGVGFSFLLY